MSLFREEPGEYVCIDKWSSYILLSPVFCIQMRSEHLVPLYIGTGLFAGLFILLPCFIKKGPNRGVIRCSIYITVFCMWLFWATVYIAQMNPLVGPRHKNVTLIWMRHLEGVKPAEPPATEPPTPPDSSGRSGRRRFSHCQEPPDNLFECCNIPWLPRRASAKCIKQPVNVLKLTCEETRCAFREAGWSDRSGFVNMRQMQTYYDTLVRTDQDWAEAVQSIQKQCLTNTPRFQGTYINCLEFDIMFCAITRMFKHAPLASWSTAAACLASRQYLTACPLCPIKCIKRISEDSEALCQACVTF